MTDPRRPTGEHGPTRPVRSRERVAVVGVEHPPEPAPRPSLPAELSWVHELLEEALSRRTTADESMISARVTEDVRGRTTRYRWGLGGLGAALLGLGSWAVAEVRSYGDERAAAVRAEAKAEEAAADAARVRTELDDARARVDALEPKVDRALAGIEQLLAREPEETTRVTVPRKPRPR